MTLTPDDVETLSKEEILSEDVFIDLLAINIKTDLVRMEMALRERAKKLKVLKDFNSLYKAYRDVAEGRTGTTVVAKPPDGDDLLLDRDATGRISATVENFVTILETSRAYKNRSFWNEFSCRPEVRDENGVARAWTDTDDAAATRFCEHFYGIYSPPKLDAALRIVWGKHREHPVRELVSSLEWDGQNRIENLFIKWLAAGDTPYNREAARLLFAGGINRLFRPGCKFDDMIVFVGGQGCGKSSFARWLAMNDNYYAEVMTIDGQQGMEGIQGAWICEVSELLALKRTKEVEGVKAFLSRQVDRWRESYDRRLSEHPRQCIFIGTTNNHDFLTDRTGNRRYFPVFVYSDGRQLYKRERECREYIIQCWAEAYARYQKGELPPVANGALLQEITAMQQSVTEDDYRYGMIEQYLDEANIDAVCIPMLWKNALGGVYEPTKQERNEIAAIMDALGWVRKERVSFAGFGRQRGWIRPMDIDF